MIPRLTTVRDYDKWNRLMGVTATPSGSTMPAMGKRGYEYNAAQQRMRQTLEGKRHAEHLRGCISVIAGRL